VGRKLDFLLQEMNREVNTMAAKDDACASRSGHRVEGRVEKMEKQVQNVE